MKTYSLDLRERIIEAVERGDQTKREIARLFNVHESFIYKLFRQQRESGHIAPLPHGGGAQAKLQPKHFALLAELVAQAPDATLEELREQLRKKGRVKVGLTTVWRTLETLQLSLKKRPAGRQKLIRLKEQNSRENKTGFRSKD